MFFVPSKTDHPTTRRPWAVYAIVAVNVVALAATALAADWLPLVYRLGFVPARHAPLSLVSHMFLHVGLWHLFFNMAFLTMFGPNVEEALGSRRFVVAYLVCGLCAAAFQFVWMVDSTRPMIGASGAISGVLGLYMALFPKVKTDADLLFLVFPIKTFKTTALRATLAWLGCQLGFAALRQVGLFPIPIAFWAHIGGLLGGVALGWLWLRWRERRAYDGRLLLPPLPPATPEPAAPGAVAMRKGASTRESVFWWAFLALYILGNMVGDEVRADLNLHLTPLIEPRPATEGMAVPQPAAPISPRNAFEVAPLAQWKVGNGVLEIDLSPDGTLVALENYFEQVQVWRMTNGQRLNYFGMATSSTDVAWSERGTLLIASETRGRPSDVLVNEWQVPGGGQVYSTTVPIEAEFMGYVTFDGRGEWLAVDADEGWQLWSLSDMRQVSTIQASSSATVSLFRPQFEQMVIASWTYVGDEKKEATVWDFRSGQLIQAIPVSTDVDSLAWSSDGALLAVGGENEEIEVRRVADQRLLYTLKQHTSRITAIAFSPDGAILATGEADGTIWLWRMADGKPLFPLQQPLNDDVKYVERAALTALQFTPDGRFLVSAASDGTVRLWGVR